MLKTLFLALTLLTATEMAHAATTRTWYIAADEVVWNFAPSGMNLITGEPLGPEEAFWAVQSEFKIGSEYKKAIYREYTDDTFTVLKPRPDDEAYLGIVGPVIRAEVGDTIRIIFKNNAPFPATLHPHGVFYEKDAEGAVYQDKTSGADKKDDGVPTGETHEYIWEVTERAGPGPADRSSILWMYHSHHDEVRDVNAGLMGPMVIMREGMMGEDGKPTDVDQEFIITFFEFLENESHYIQDNINTYIADPDSVEIVKDPFGGDLMVVKGKPAVADFNLIESLNGFTYGNLPMITMRQGEKVRWHLMASTNFEVHAPHWHGNVVDVNGHNMDVLSLTTMGMVTAEMVPDNPGVWLFHCHTGGHFVAGMTGRYEVLPEEG